MINLTNLTVHIINRLERELPGKEAHFKMIPRIRIPEFDVNPEVPRNSSVLILLYPKNDTVCFALIRRPEYAGVHSGQISLPGGKADESDAGIEATALREAKEEIGIDPAQVKLLGRLSKLFVTPSNFMIYPVIGYLSQTPYFVGDDKEVAEIYDIPLTDLTDQANIKIKAIRLHRGTELVTPYYDIQGLTIWGATAMILSEFSDIVADCEELTQSPNSIS